MKTKELTFRIWWRLFRKHVRLMTKETVKVSGIILAGILLVLKYAALYFLCAVKFIWNTILDAIDCYPRACVGTLLFIFITACFMQYVDKRVTEETLSYRVDSLKLVNDKIQECSRYDEGFTAGLLEADTMHREDNP